MALAIRRFDTRQILLEELIGRLRRPPLDRMPLDPEATARTEALFGQALAPAEAVRRIVERVRQEGDGALVELTARLDGVVLDPEELWLTPEQVEAARREVLSWGPEGEAFVSAVRVAAANIRAFHERQKPKAWFFTRSDGTLLGMRPVPVDSAAVYVPGGTAPLLSTALMGAIPARVAGVSRVVVATPPSRREGAAWGYLDPRLVVAAAEAGADGILQAGGAQAIAALAFGTGRVEKVDKLVGPGNLFVQLAKKEVSAVVGIDGLNGPSEVLIIADTDADPEWVAADLLAQAEHAPDAAAVLLTDHEPLLDRVAGALEVQLGRLPRSRTAGEALARWGALVLCRTLDEAVQLANLWAPEHLELLVRQPMTLFAHIRHAGAVFFGPCSPEALGDYAAGPNHTLPTNGTARFGSALTVESFIRWQSLIAASRQGLLELAPVVELLAAAEGLEAHRNSVRLRRLREEQEGQEGQG